MLKSSRKLSPIVAGLAVLAVPAMSQVVQAHSMPVVRSGSHGPAVSQAERQLKMLGLYHGGIDGDFGPQLLSSVRKFQGQHGLAQDGVIGPLTWGRLSAAVSSPETTTNASPTFHTAAAMLRLGDRGPAVVHVQHLLNLAGSHLAQDGDYGPLTYAAVRNFQAHHGLAVNGIVGASTLDTLTHLHSGSTSVSAKPEAPPVRYLKEGTSGAPVTKLQTELTHLGYAPGGIDGQFGPETRAAVIAFQKAHGLPDYGYVGTITWNALSKALTKPPTPVSRGGVSSTGAAIAGYAMSFKGYRYVYGGATPQSGFDCSGLTQWVYAHFGMSLPRTSYAQWNVGTHVSSDALEPGDLVFFTTDGRFAGHVGIYLGNGAFISAATPSQGVIVQNLGEAYWAHAYDGAVRLAPGA